MGIDVITTTLWAELATWREPALEILLRPEYWAVHGATRMGKALTFDDRVGEQDIDLACVERGVKSALALMELLGRADGSPAIWSERTAGLDDPRHAVDTSELHIDSVGPDGVELLTALAHALQGGARLASTASEAEIRAAIASPPRSAPRPSGPFSALLVMSTDTLWVPVALHSAWDSPAGVFASSVHLAEDLRALPDLLHAPDGTAPDDLASLQYLVETLEAALTQAGTERCVRMSG